MHILIITSCTGEKCHNDEQQLALHDFQQGADHLAQREQQLAHLLTRAEDLYTGEQHVRLMRGIRALRNHIQAQSADITLDLWVLSAGYGLVRHDRRLAPYECTFQGMKKPALRDWATRLNIPTDIRRLLAQPYDLGMLLLGDSYLEACALDETVKPGGTTLVFCGPRMAKRLPALDNTRTIPLTNQESKRFSCGLVGLKGEISGRLLQKMTNSPLLIEQLRQSDADILALAESVPSLSKPSRQPSRANPHVDQVIDLPASWQQKPHRQTFRYFIPEWDDLVDPDYDFAQDIHSGGGGDWSNEVFAHQLYREPNYDGILISKIVAEKSKKKKERINRLGVHRYLRLPRAFPIMGDCGAFGYIKEQKPPYTTAEILDYYTRLDFDYGVSIDHLIVRGTEQQKQFRYDLTIHNAEEFLREHRQCGLSWVPIGAVQGWDPQSYADAARQCVAMGYDYIGLGGLVRTSTPDVLRILQAVHAVVPERVRIHLFGLARLRALNEFVRLGVHSVDSASFLRRAWMGAGQNYLVASGAMYAAIRIPEAGKSFRAKRIVSEGRATMEQVARYEADCLQAMREFDRGKRSVEATLDVLEAYDQLITDNRASIRPLMRRTLEAAPWKTCPCDICQRDGVEVIIFRGNNRNRRRGFHNTYVFYRILQRILAGETEGLIWNDTDEDAEESPTTPVQQLPLFAER